MRFPFLPKDSKFFSLFVSSARNAVQAANLLKDMIDSWTDIEVKVNQMDDLEHTGDTITHEIIALLHRTFVTPYDREDIAALAQTLDDVVDFIHDTAMAMHMYKVTYASQYAKELADIIVDEAAEVEKAVYLIQHHAKLKHVLEHCVEINRLENMADAIFRRAMAQLFEDTADIAEVIKWREIYQHMEIATDRCEDVANVLEGIALKHA